MDRKGIIAITLSLITLVAWMVYNNGEMKKVAAQRALVQAAADAEQAMATLTALSRRGFDVTMVVPSRPSGGGPTPAQLREYYQLRGEFAIEELLNRGSALFAAASQGQ